MVARSSTRHSWKVIVVVIKTRYNSDKSLPKTGGGGSKLFNTDCNFEPTCSEYAKQAIEAKGILAAFPIIVNRLRRCNEPDKVGRDLDPFLENSDV